MSIIRHVDGKNNDRDFLEKKKDYITDSVKTDNGELVGSHACIDKHGLKDWYAVKKIHHKSGGKQGEHFALSLTPDNKSVPNSNYTEIAHEVVNELFSEYNCIFAVHTDSKYRHIHFLVNSVSFTDGRRYHLSKSDLAEMRRKLNRILDNHGFDIICVSTDKMVDDTPYDLSEGFDCLEINDDEPYSGMFKDILADPSNDTFFDKVTAETPLNSLLAEPCKDGIFDCNKPCTQIFHPEIAECRESVYNDNYESEENFMPDNNFYNSGYSHDLSFFSKPQTTVENNYVGQQNQLQTTVKSNPHTSTDNLPVQPTVSNNPPVQYPVSNDYPNLNIYFNTVINADITPSTNPEQFKEFLNASAIKTNVGKVLECSVEALSKLQDKNVKANINAFVFPTVNLNFCSDSDDTYGNIVDIE